MRILSGTAFAGASILVLALLVAPAGMLANAQPPGTSSAVTQADDADGDEDETGEAEDDQPAADASGGASGGGAAAPLATPDAKLPAPAVAKTPATSPAGATPETLPLGSSGNGGTGGNGRPTQDPDKG